LARAERLAAALRENLRRRKAQARARETSGASSGADQPGQEAPGPGRPDGRGKRGKHPA
jgi:hypothetical protein